MLIFVRKEISATALVLNPPRGQRAGIGEKAPNPNWFASGQPHHQTI